VRTRLYFTSESHLHSLFNVLRFAAAQRQEDEHARSFPGDAATRSKTSPRGSKQGGGKQGGGRGGDKASPRRPSRSPRRGPKSPNLNDGVPPPVPLGHSVSSCSIASLTADVPFSKSASLTHLGLPGPAVMAPRKSPPVPVPTPISRVLRKVDSVSEINYLTHIVFKVFETSRPYEEAEDAAVSSGSSSAGGAGEGKPQAKRKRFRVTILFSSGVASTPRSADAYRFDAEGKRLDDDLPLAPRFELYNLTLPQLMGLFEGLVDPLNLEVPDIKKPSAGSMARNTGGGAKPKEKSGREQQEEHIDAMPMPEAIPDARVGDGGGGPSATLRELTRPASPLHTRTYDTFVEEQIRRGSGAGAPPAAAGGGSNLADQFDGLETGK